MPGFRPIPQIQSDSQVLSRVQSQIAGAVEPQLKELYERTAAVSPSTPGGSTQTGHVYQGVGVPSDVYGASGDVYLRTDTPGTANQRLYVKNGTTWTGIL